MNEALDHLRRRGLGAALTFTCWLAAACGGNSDDLSGPGPPPPTDEGIAPTAGCTDRVLEHGALYRICFPAAWNGDLVLYAHGFVPAHQEIALPEDVIGGQSISGTLTGLGYAFATTSYRANGLVAPEAADDLVELEATVRRLYRPDPGRSVIVGFSEGGLVATLAAERVAANFDAAAQLIRMTGAPVAGNDLRSMAETSVGVLWYDVFGIADARARLGGQPFDNSARVYTGSSNDPALNAGVQRHPADPAALAGLARFQTSGSLQVPLTTVHTTGDPIVPFSQSQLYGEKVSRTGAAALLAQNTIDRP